MTVKSSIARVTAKTSYWFLRNILHRGGTSLPGKLAVSIDPDILTLSLEPTEKHSRPP